LLFEQPERINTQFSERMMPMNEFYEKLRVKLQPVSSVYFTSKNQDGGKKNKRRKTKKISNKKRYVKSRKMKK
jgi:hypothetical protein